MQSKFSKISSLNNEKFLKIFFKILAQKYSINSRRIEIEKHKKKPKKTKENKKPKNEQTNNQKINRSRAKKKKYRSPSEE